MQKEKFIKSPLKMCKLPNIIYVHNEHKFCGIDDVHLYGNRPNLNQAQASMCYVQKEMIISDGDDNANSEDSKNIHFISP